jgi:hypothetical protein
LKVVASQNMEAIVVTLPTFHPCRGWLKLVASWNMVSILVTKPLFHPFRGWLKTVASWNILSILVTELSSCLDMSPLKLCLLVNKELMSVMPIVHHVPISPYIALFWRTNVLLW